MKAGDKVRIVCPDRERGTVCDNVAFGGAAVVAVVSNGRAWLHGHPRSFSLRAATGRWERAGTRTGTGPYLIEGER